MAAGGRLQGFLRQDMPERSEKRAVLAILMAGISARMLWTLLGDGLKPFEGESHNVAVSLAASGRFADPMANGGGYTAHVSMFTPLPSALGYWFFGADTTAAEIALTLLASLLVSVSIWFCWRLACELGMPFIARLGAVVFTALIPLQFNLEVREGRSWEVNAALVLMLWVLLRLVMAEHQKSVVFSNLAWIGAVTGFLFIVSPPAGLAAATAVATFHILQVDPKRWWIGPVFFLCVAGPLAAFWAERNLAAVGAAIALRDNFGMELDISNYSGAVHPVNPGAAYVERIQDIHPLKAGPANAKLVAAGGEVSYYDKLGKEAWKWIGNHPGDFVYLSIRRFQQYYLPPRWFWGTFGQVQGKAIWLRQVLVWLTVISGVLTLCWMAWRKRSYLYVAAVTLACSFPYILVQPILRYRYLVSSLLIFLAFEGWVRLISFLCRQKRLRFFPFLSS